MESLKERLDKVMKKAREFGIDDDIKKEERKMRDTSASIMPEGSSNGAIHANLLRKKKVMLQAFESQKKKTDMMIMKEKKEYKELCGQKSQLNQQLDEKINILKEKTERMSELIEKAKKYSDPTTQELLSKWEASNQKMKEMYETEANGREQRREIDATPNAKDIDKLINKLQKDKPVSKKNLPEVKSHRKSVKIDDESQHNVSMMSDRKSQVNEHKSIVSNSSKPPLKTNNQRRTSQPDRSEEESDEDYIGVQKNEPPREEEEVKSTTSKPAFASKPFGKPSLASKPAFAVRAPSNQSENKPTSKPSFASIGNKSEKSLHNDEQEPDPAEKKEPVSFSQKYGLNSNASKPAQFVQSSSESKFNARPVKEPVSTNFGGPIVNYTTDSKPDSQSRR